MKHDGTHEFRHRGKLRDYGFPDGRTLEVLLSDREPDLVYIKITDGCTFVGDRAALAELISRSPA